VKTDSKSGAASKSGDREEPDMSLEDGYFAGIWRRGVRERGQQGEGGEGSGIEY